MLKDHLDHQYLTRSDIAQILKISPRQAGRLMEEMPCIPIGLRQWRVSRPDFEAWIERKKMEDSWAESEKLQRSSKGVMRKRATDNFSRSSVLDPDRPSAVRKYRPLF